MNTSTFREILINVAESEGSNLVSKIIAYYYPSLDFSSRNNLFESLLNRLQLTEKNRNFDFKKLKNDLPNDNEIFNVKDYENKDYRIKEIEISNLRGIPEIDENNNIPYGISLLDEKNNINSAIILANNGVGKSSVFAGLEMIYAQEIGEKKLRTLNPDNLQLDDFNDYLKNVRSTDKPVCRVKAVDGEFSLNNKVFKNQEVLKHINPQAHFISEYDIIRNGQSLYNGKGENTIHNIVADSLGLSEFLNTLQISEQISSYRRTKEITLKNNISRQIEENEKIIEKSENLIQLKLRSIDELQNDRKIQVNQDNYDKIDKLKRFLINTSSLILDENNEEIKLVKYIDNYLQAFDNYSSIDTNKKVSVEIEFLNAGKELLHEYDDCPYCRNSKNTLDEIRKRVQRRLEELNEINVLYSQIFETFQDATRELYDTIQSYLNIYRLVQSEGEVLFDLIDISKDKAQLYEVIEPLINDDELIRQTQRLFLKKIPTDKDFFAFTELLNNNEKLFRSFLIKYHNRVSSIIVNINSTIQNKINSLSKDASYSNEFKTINNLEDEIKELKASVKIASERIQSLERELIHVNKLVSDVEQIKSEIIFFNSKLRIEVDKIVENSFQAFREPIEKILNDYFIDDSNFKLTLSLKEYPVKIDEDEFISRNIIAEIIDKENPEIKTSPDQYFNTFRFKLFSLMIGLSIALASRKKYKVNLPLVIDDLFYGSDYVSKNTFAKFIQDLILLFYKHTPDMPLQILLFTHDNFIYKSALEGIGYLNISKKGFELGKTKKSRMFHPSDKQKEESISGFKYWNLINN